MTESMYATEIVDFKHYGFREGATAPKTTRNRKSESSLRESCNEIDMSNLLQMSWVELISLPIHNALIIP